MLAELEDTVHSLIVILNNKLEEVLGEDAEMDECFRAADDVLHNACAGIAEIINVPGLVNVDFEDVKTVMSEQGKAMMGTATGARAGPRADRGRAGGGEPAARRRRFVGRTRRAGQHHGVVFVEDEGDADVMNTIRAFAADDATVIFGTVCDETIGDGLRVTVVATGLGRAASKKQSTPFTVVRTGTDNAPLTVSVTAAHGSSDYSDFEKPAIWRTRDPAQTRVAAHGGHGIRSVRHSRVFEEAG